MSNWEPKVTWMICPLTDTDKWFDLWDDNFVVLLILFVMCWICGSWDGKKIKQKELMLAECNSGSNPVFIFHYWQISSLITPLLFSVCPRSGKLIRNPSKSLIRVSSSQSKNSHSSHIPSVQFSSIAQSCWTLCDPINCSTLGLPVHHQLPEFTETHVNWVGDAIQPSDPLLSPSASAPNPSQHQSLFQWVNSSHEVAKVLRVSASTSVLPKNTQDWSPLGWIGWMSLQSKGLSRVFSNTTVQKHQFFRAQLSSQYNSHIHTWLLEKP